MEKTIRSLWMPTAGMLTGARRAAMLLLTTLLLTMTAQTAWAVDVTLSVDNDIAEGNVGHYYVNMPTTGTNTLTLTAEDIAAGKDIFKVYDDGGKSDDYSWYCNGYLVMTAPEGYIIMLEGTVTNSVKDKAKFNVYDGEYNGSGEPSILGANYGSANEAGGIVSHASTGRSMTLYFWSDDWRDKGLNLTVTLINPNTEYHVNCSADSHGEVTACPTSAKALSEITLTANPADGYLLSGINVVASGISVDVDWSIFSNTAKFTMPTSDVTVTPTFTNDLANLSINMPTTGSKSVCVPASISSLKVYDDGGPSGNYTNHNCDGTITLTAPSGYILQMTGTVNSCSKTDGTKVDYLEVYDGADRNAARLGNNQYGLSSGEDIGTLTSSGQSMTLRFYADAYNSYEGLDLTVTLIKVIEYNINLAENVTGGSVVSDVASAKQGTTVTLTATPNEGYLLDGISVVDENGAGVALNHDVAWYTGRNTATFTMPFSAVTVTPTFVSANDNLFLNMPKTGSFSAQIPIAVNYVKVYDDGGESGRYSDNCDGTLTLTAPENCVLQLTGNIKIRDYDYLSVYDGASTSATALLTEKHSDVVGMVLQTTDLGVITSSARSMTLHFFSDSNNGSDGLNLSVKAISQNADLSINIATVQHGEVKVEGNATTAKVNDVITLKATPDEGYALGGLSVVDGSSTAVATEWNVFENTATFTMPGSAVTVTPVFVSTNPLSINIPAVGTVKATIPAGITSMKVYDNGGASGVYTGCDGSLVLTAPEGYWLTVEGTILAENDDVLKVYSGTEMISANYLFQVSGLNKNDVHNQSRDIVSHVCTGRTVLLNFASSSNPNNYAGLDLTVSLTGSIENTGTSNTITLTQDNYQGTTATLDGASEGSFSITADVAVADVKLSRTFESGKKTTICWPFAVDASKAAALGTFYQFKSINGEGKIEMEQVTTGLEANKPYIFEPSSDKTLIDFGAKTLKAGGPQSVGSGFTFKGIYGLVKWTTDTSDPLYDATFAGELGKAYGFALKDKTVGTTSYQKGQFVRLGSGAYGRAFRAYMLSDGAWDGNQPTAGARKRSAASSLPDVIDIVWLPAQGGTTGISTVGNISKTDGWWTLDGRKLDGKPAKKGVYINNGKKVVIR